MAWGTKKAASPPSSTLAKIFPLLLLVLVLAVVAFVGFQVYCAANDIASSAGKKLEEKQIICSRDGVKVSVKQVGDEKYVDKTQR